MNCLKRFISRRGILKLVVSDNAKTFKCYTLKTFLSCYNISRKFNVPQAPWWGGFSERLVRSVKRRLKKVMGTSKVNYEEFETLPVEVEGILNSRPLTYVSGEFLHPLTPSSWCVSLRLLDQVAEAKYRDGCNSLKGPLKRQKHLNLVIDHFWKRWRREYITELGEHHHGRKKSEKRRVQGDVVCIHADLKSHQNWKVEVVQKLIPGRDGRVRAAFVCLVSGGKCMEFCRPVERLYPIEVLKDNHEEPDIKFVSDKEVKNFQASG